MLYKKKSEFTFFITQQKAQLWGVNKKKTKKTIARQKSNFCFYILQFWEKVRFAREKSQNCEIKNLKIPFCNIYF